jgi:hypothetical protein
MAEAPCLVPSNMGRWCAGAGVMLAYAVVAQLAMEGLVLWRISVKRLGPLALHADVYHVPTCMSVCLQEPFVLLPPPHLNRSLNCLVKCLANV